MDARRLLKFAFLVLYNVKSITRGEYLDNRQVAFNIHNFLNSQNCLKYSIHPDVFDDVNYLTKSWLEICEWLKQNERNQTKSSKLKNASVISKSEHQSIAVDERENDIFESKENKTDNVESTIVQSTVRSATLNGSSEKEISDDNTKDIAIFNFNNPYSTEPDDAISFRTKIYTNAENEENFTFKVSYETLPTKDLSKNYTEQESIIRFDILPSFEPKQNESNNSTTNSNEEDSSIEYKILTTSITVPIATKISSSKDDIEHALNAPLSCIRTSKTENTTKSSSGTVISIVNSENLYATKCFPKKIRTTRRRKYTTELFTTESSTGSNLRSTENLYSAEKINFIDKQKDEEITDPKDQIISNSLFPSNEEEKFKELRLIEIDICSKLNSKSNTSTYDQKPEELIEANICPSGKLDPEQVTMPSPSPMPSHICVTLDPIDSEKSEFFPPDDLNCENSECQNFKSDEISSTLSDNLNQPDIEEPLILSSAVPCLGTEPTIKISNSNGINDPRTSPKQMISPFETTTSPTFVEILQNNLKANDSSSSSFSSFEKKSQPISYPTKNTFNEPKPSCFDDDITSFLPPKSSSSNTICEILDFVPASVKNLTVNLKNIDDSRHRTHVRLEHFDSNAGFFNTNHRLGLHLFFWFFRSSCNYRKAPLIVWLQGEPGWSSLYGFFEEHGPYYVDETDHGEITMKLRKFTWVKDFNVLYLDHSAGCGFSMATSQESYRPTFDNVGKNVYYALYQFFKVFFEFQSNDLYLAGSYGGAKYLPIIAHVIHSKNRFSDLNMNLKGLMIGGPYIDAGSMVSYSNILYTNGLIDEKKQKEMEMNQYYIASLINANKYKQAIENTKKLIYSEIERAGYEQFYDIRYPKYPKRRDGRYAFETYMPRLIQSDMFKTMIRINEVRFQRNSNILIEEIMCPVEHLIPQLLANYKILYYNGQFDLITPYSTTAHYISRMHWQSADNFYSLSLNNWYVTDNSNPIGYWKSTKNVTHVMIRDAGHTVGRTNSESLYHLLKWFVQDKFEMKEKNGCVY